MKQVLEKAVKYLILELSKWKSEKMVHEDNLIIYSFQTNPVSETKEIVKSDLVLYDTNVLNENFQNLFEVEKP